METILIIYFAGLLSTILGVIIGGYMLEQGQTNVSWLLIAVLLWPVFAARVALDSLFYLWKRLIMRKTLMYVLVLLAILVFLGVCTFADAASPLKISPPVNVFEPVTYPDKVVGMTDAEFFKWATAKNKAARADWKERYYLAGDKYIVHKRKTTKSRYTGMGNMQSVIMTGGKIGDTDGESFTQQYESTYRYANPDFRHPGPLTIVNPYFRKK